MWDYYESKQEQFKELLVRLDSLNDRYYQENGQKRHDIDSTICSIYTVMVRYYPDEYDSMDEKYKVILREHLR